jgi:hypothetical protein
MLATDIASAAAPSIARLGKTSLNVFILIKHCHHYLAQVLSPAN